MYISSFTSTLKLKSTQSADTDPFTGTDCLLMFQLHKMLCSVGRSESKLAINICNPVDIGGSSFTDAGVCVRQFIVVKIIH